MAELRFPGVIDQAGRFRPDRDDIFASELAMLAGKRVVFTVKRERDTRSLEQNKYLWAGVYGEAVADSVEFVELATGQQVFQSMEDVHGFAKLALLRRPVMTNRGEIDLLGSTTTLSTSEFSKYIEMLVAKLAQYGVYIPQRSNAR